MVHVYNPNSKDAEAKGSRVQGQPGLHSKTMPQNKVHVIIQKEYRVSPPSHSCPSPLNCSQRQPMLLNSYNAFQKCFSMHKQI
jgi:hypothetical protein